MVKFAKLFDCSPNTIRQKSSSCLSRKNSKNTLVKSTPGGKSSLFFLEASPSCQTIYVFCILFWHTYVHIHIWTIVSTAKANAILKMHVKTGHVGHLQLSLIMLILIVNIVQLPNHLTDQESLQVWKLTGCWDLTKLKNFELLYSIPKKTIFIAIFFRMYFKIS